MPNEPEYLSAGYYLKRAEILYEKSDYDSLPHYYSEALRLSSGSNDTSMVIECYLGLAEYHRIISEFKIASAYLEQANCLLNEKSGGYTDAKAGELYIRAKISAGKGEFMEALRYARMASGINGLKNHQKNSRYLNFIGSIHNLNGDFDSAEYYYSASFREINSVTEGPAIEKAWYFLNMSQIYNRRGELDIALDYLQKNVQIYIRLYGYDFPELMNSYINLGYYYIESGSVDSARTYLNKAELLILKDSISGSTLIPSLYEGNGILTLMEGNYPAAHIAYQHALETAIQIYGAKHPLLYRYYNNCANTYRAMGNFKDALLYYHKAAEIVQRMHPSRILTSYYYLAVTYAASGSTEEADYYYNRLISGRTDFLGPGHPLLSYDYLSYGNFLRSQGKTIEAKKYLESALEIRLKKFGTKHYLTSESYMYLGRYFREIKDYDQALSYFQKALTAVASEFDDMDYHSNPGISENINFLTFIKILKDKAWTLEQKGRMDSVDHRKLEYMDASYRTCQTAVNVILQMQNEWLTEESRLYLAENENEVFLSLIKISLSLFDLTAKKEYLAEGFGTAEKMKYSTLLATLRDQKAIKEGKVPDDLKNQDRQIRMELAAYHDLVDREYKDELPDSVKIINWNRKIFELNNKRKELVRQLSKRYPDYYSLKYFPGIMKVKSIQNKLGDDDLLTEYVLSDTSLIIFILDNHKLTYRQIGIDSSFYKNIRLVYDFIRTDYFKSSSEQIPYFINASSELFKILFGNFHLEAGKRLIIIPDGMLAYIPFDILLTQPVEGNDYHFGELSYLVRNHPLSFAYSATLLFQSDHRKVSTGKELLAFAPSDPDVTQMGTNPGRFVQSDRSKLKPLVGSAKEVRSIINIVGGDSRIGNEASEYSFKELAPKYRILHLAAHALIDEDDPLNSKLVFSPDKEGDEDGMLNLAEIYNLDLKARMVVLSACNTGYGKLKKGEGIMSLARAFFYAGVPDVVITLWPVSDGSSVPIMTHFYQNLARGKSKDEALRNAKLTFLEEVDPIIKHPFYWAGYIVVGDNSRIFRPAITKYMIIGIILVFLASGLIYKNRIFKEKRRKEGSQIF